MHLIYKFLIGVIVSFYLFPISFTFLPLSLNTKMILAVLGIIAFYLDHTNIQKISVNKNLIVTIFIGILFSIICLISADINVTVDYSYATYIVSLCVWLSSSYFVGSIIRAYHGTFSFKILIYYLLGVCVFQCFSALAIDNFPAFANLVNSVVYQGQDFLTEINRLYGIGASLDPAGVRFAGVLILTGALLSHDNYTRKKGNNLTMILISFFIIAIVGNMISRTTVVGFIAGLIYFVVFSGLFRLKILYDSLKLGFIFALVLILVIGIASYLYSTNQEFYTNLRFAFEGFFNWIEYGEWRTDSTDKLNNEMWIWPSDLKTWIIGSGLFGNFVYGTDIGYCRFILYCGLIGFSTFALLFVYNAFAFSLMYPKYWALFLVLGALSFVVWIKVATDIFFIFALLYCLDTFEDQVEEIEIKSHNSALQREVSI